MKFDATEEGKMAAGKMITGEQELQKSIDDFLSGSGAAGLPDALQKFIEFGFWMGTNACMTRALYMVEESGKGVKGMRPNDLLDEIGAGLENVSTEDMFKAFK